MKFPLLAALSFALVLGAGAQELPIPARYTRATSTFTQPTSPIFPGDMQLNGTLTVDTSATFGDSGFTIDATGVVSTAKARISTATPMAAMVVDTTLINNTKTIAAAGNPNTLTVSGTPSTNTLFGLKITATNACTLTWPAGTWKSIGAGGATITTSTFLSGEVADMQILYDGAIYWIYGAPVHTLALPGATSGTTTLTASAVAGTTTVTLPASTDTLVGLATTDSLTNKTLVGPIITYASGALADDTYNGRVFITYNASATITQWHLVYMDSSSTWKEADANGSGTYPVRGIATAAGSNGNPLIVLEDGVFRDDGGTAWTPGGTIYLSTAVGDLTQTPPATTGDKIQVVGFALSAHVVRLKLSPDYGTSP